MIQSVAGIVRADSGPLSVMIGPTIVAEWPGQIIRHGLDYPEDLYSYNYSDMTLHEARHTLEVANPRDAAIRQAIKVVLTALPDDPEPYRPQAQKRADAILAAIARQKDGFNPFKERSREQKYTLWRYAVWHQMRLEGYSFTQIGRATGYDHSTAYWGERRFTDWLSVHDYETTKTWKELQEIIEKPEPKYYGD